MFREEFREGLSVLVKKRDAARIAGMFGDEFLEALSSRGGEQLRGAFFDALGDDFKINSCGYGRLLTVGLGSGSQYRLTNYEMLKNYEAYVRVIGSQEGQYERSVLKETRLFSLD